jgi:thioredoxin reductase
MENQRRDFIKKSGIALASFINPFDVFSTNKEMKENHFETIIIGGSFAGLSAAMSLGRSLRKVLIIDNQQPCNAQTPHSHNFLTQDGKPPLEILAEARKQLEAYPTVKFINDTAISASKSEDLFEIKLQKNGEAIAPKLVLAWGLKDDTSKIEGLEKCWGISVIHCPYCHGYEVKNQPTAIISNGNEAFEYIKMINHWTKNLTLLTNGSSNLTEEQTHKIKSKGIQIIEKPITKINHQSGKVTSIGLKDAEDFPISVIYHRASFTQKSEIAAQLGCEIDEMGLIKVNDFQQTNVKGVFAAGDNASPLRQVANAVAKGSLAGVMANRELIEESF